jgi:hypothetical protein
MPTDPILHEVYRIKEELNREIGGDMEKLFERFREFARQNPERMVQPKPKPIKRSKQQP